MKSNWKPLEALRERRQLIAAQAAAHAALEAQRSAQAARQSLAAVDRIVQARTQHDVAVHTPDASGKLPVAALQGCGAWNQVLDRAIAEADRQAGAAGAAARSSEQAWSQARHAAARAAARHEAAHKGLERQRLEARECQERQDEVRAEAHGHLLWSAQAARQVE